MKKEYIKRYSQAFKQQIIKEYEAGASANYLSEKYGIRGGNTIKNWVKKYGKKGYRNEVVQIQTVEDQEEVKGMRQRIKELEAALAQSVLDKRMLETIVEVSSRELGIDLKKNLGSRS